MPETIPNTVICTSMIYLEGKTTLVHCMLFRHKEMSGNSLHKHIRIFQWSCLTLLSITVPHTDLAHHIFEHTGSKTANEFIYKY